MTKRASVPILNTNNPLDMPELDAPSACTAIFSNVDLFSFSFVAVLYVYIPGPRLSGPHDTRHRIFFYDTPRFHDIYWPICEDKRKAPLSATGSREFDFVCDFYLEHCH